jgi:nitroreductase
MDIPFSRWYPVIAKRCSRRRYDESRPIPPDVLASLQKMCRDFRPFPEARTELVTESSERVFKGAVGPYGKVRGAPAYLAFIGNMASVHVQEGVGYTGEGLILEAAALGLDTCWVAGFFRPVVVAEFVKLAAHERVLAVSPVGYARGPGTLEEKFMTGFGQTHRRRPLSNLVSGLPIERWPDWVKPALEAAALAPSAVNRQPWRFDISPEAITVITGGRTPEFNVSKRLDCGIAMLHIEVAALVRGIQGRWELLAEPQVARLKY